MGQAAEVKWPLETFNSPQFFPDGQHLFICGSAPGKPSACYRSALDGSGLERLTPDSVRAGLLRPDGKAVLYATWNGEIQLQVFGAGAPERVPPLPADLNISRWSPDGRSVWGRMASEPARLVQVEVATGRVSTLGMMELPPGEATRIFDTPTLADDPRVYAFAVRRFSSQLFVVRGAK